MENSEQTPDYNPVALRAKQITEMGQSLDPTYQDLNLVAEAPKQQTYLDYFAANKAERLDLNDPNTKATWEQMIKESEERVTDWNEVARESIKMIAGVPVDLIKGIAENPNPLVVAGSTAQGVVKGLADLWNMVTQSEDPLSPIFHVRAAATALMTGKSRDWRAEVAQWNAARETNYNTHLMEEGKESMVDRVMNLSPEERARVNSYINPKVAHAMSFVGLELPAIGRALLTSGAKSAVAAATARTTLNVEKTAGLGAAMAAGAKRFEKWSLYSTQTIASKTLSATGKVLEYPAAAIQGLVGRNIERAAGYAGVSDSVVRNAAETAVAFGGEVDAAAGVQRTVGILGSLGVRTGSELAGAYGTELANAAKGLIPNSQFGLTTLERVAANPLLSPTAKAAAKFINVTIDPILQLSTATLKHSYKGALEFGILGYLNDRDRGAVGGAAMGMVWSGYSGALRHSWSVINGGFSHRLIIDSFDGSFYKKFGSVNQEATAAFKTVIEAIDNQHKNEKISANTRQTVRQAVDMLGDKRKNLIVEISGDSKTLQDKLQNKGVKDYGRFEAVGKGSFQVAVGGEGQIIPIITLNPKNFRAADVGHEILGHVASFVLEESGKIGIYHAELFGYGKNKGILPDSVMADKLAKRHLAEMYTSDVKMAEYENVSGKKAYDNKGNLNPEFRSWVETKSASELSYYRKLYQDRIEEFRKDFPNKQDYYTAGQNSEPILYEKHKRDETFPGARWMFEELVSGHQEGLFTFTNLADNLIPEAEKPIRYYFESVRNDLFAKKLSQVELSGTRVNRVFGPDGTPQVQLEVFDDGKWHKHEGMDGFAQKLVRDAMNLDSNSIYRMSPEKMAVEAKKHGKEYMFNPAGKGVTMKGEKERNEISDAMSKKSMEIIKNLPDNLKVEIELDEFENETVDLTKLSDGAFNAIVQGGGMDATTAANARAIRDVIRSYHDSGFAAPNVMISDYWGASKEIVKGGWLGRLTGKDVPVTSRMFVPYELKIHNKVRDANGNLLAKPKTTMTVTAVDYLAIHNNKISNWSRPEVRRLFTSIDEMNEQFNKYIINMMQDPSVRVTSEQLFKAKYGANASKVRDVMYNIFGAVMRKDESYINTPGEGARTNKRGPNYPYHSLSLDKLVNLELTSSKPFGYHHGNSYEGLRRNLSTEGFERMTNTRYRDMQGYEIFVKGKNFKVFNPFGQEIGVVDSFKRAAKLAGKHLKKSEDADRLPTPDDFNANAFFGGAEDVVEQKRVRDRLNEHLSKFDSRGIMLQSYGLDRNGNVREFNYELVEPKLFRSIARVQADELDKLQQVTGKNMVKDVRLRNILSTKSQNELYMSFESGGVRLNYNIGNIPVIFVSKGVHEDKKLRFITGNNKNDPTIASFTEAQYVDEMRREGKLWKLHVTKNGPALIFDTHAMKSMSLTAEDKHWIVQTQFAAELDSIYNGSRTDSFRGPVARDAITASTGTYGRTIFNHKLFNALKDTDLTDLQGHPQALELIRGPAKREAIKKVKAWAALGTTEDLLFLQCLEERTKLLQKYGEYKIHRDAEGKPSTILLLPEKHFPELLLKNDAIWKASRAVRNSNISYQILELWSSHVDHFQTQTLYQQKGLIEFGNVTVAISGKNAISGKPRTTLMVNPDLFTDGANNVWFVQHSNTAVIAHGSSGTSLIASSNGAFDKNAVGGYLGDVPKVFGKIVGADDYENGVYQSVTIRDFFRMSPDRSLDEQIKYFERPISDAIREINPHAGFFSTKAHLAYCEILYKKFSETDTLKGQDILAMREKAYAFKSVETELAWLEKIKSASIESRNAQAYNASRAAIAMLRARENLTTQSDLPKFKLNISIDDYVESNYNLKLSEFNDTFFNYVGVSREGELPMIYDLINSANEDPSFMYDPAALKQLRSYADKASPYGKLGTERAMQSVIGLEKPLEESGDNFVRRMAETGLVRVLGNGKHRQGYVLFELSDKDASFTTKNNGRLELTPFIKSDDPQKALDEYMAQYGNKPSTGKYVGPKNVTLGDIFNHSEVYKHFPEIKDIPILFTDGLGALAARYADPVTGELKYHIEFGIRNLLPEEAYKNATPYADKKLYPSYLYRNQFIKEHPATSMMLHEVQHILQYKFEHKAEFTFMGAKEKTMLQKNFLRYLGARNEDLNLDKLESDNDAHQVIQGMIEDINQSPVYKNLDAHVKPLLKTYIGRIAGELAELADAGLVSGEHAKTSLELMKEVDLINSPEDAHRVYKSFESIVGFIGTQPEVQLKMAQMYDDFHAANSALEMHTVLDPANFGADQPTVHKIVSLRRAIDSFARANYFAKSIEVQARVTEKRRGLNKRELFEQPRVDIPAEGSTLELITRISNSSDIMKIKDFDGKVDSFPRTTMFSVGDLMGGEDASDVTKRLGKLALVSYVALKGSKEFQKLGRFLITQNGWEVDKDGKLVLTKKNYTVKGDFDKFYQTQKEAEAAGIYDPTSDTGNPGHSSYSYGQYSVVRGSTDGLQSTYTIDDILALSNATIEAEIGLSVGNSVVDNVLHHTFPPMIKGDKIMEALNNNAFSHSAEAYDLSGIDHIAMAIGDRHVTKTDLANLIMYYHNSLDISAVNAGESGVVPSKRSLGSIDFDTIPRERLIAAAKDTVFPDVASRLNIDTFYQTERAEIGFGVYNLDGRTLSFEFRRPSWVPEEVYQKVIAKHLESENYKNLQKTFLGSDNSSNSTAISLANSLNERLTRKLLLIEPVVKQMLEEIKSQRENNSINNDAYNAFIVGLFDKMVTDALVIHPSQFHETGNKPRGPFQESFSSGRDNQTIPPSMIQNVIKRKGLSGTVQGIGATYSGLTIKGSEYAGMGFHTPVPMIGTAWHGTPFDFNEVSNIQTSWFGTRIHPQGDTVPLGPSVESVPESFRMANPERAGQVESPFRKYYNSLDSVNNGLVKYETLTQCALNLLQEYNERMEQTKDKLAGLERTLSLYDTNPEVYANAVGIKMSEVDAKRQFHLDKIESLKRSLISDNYEHNMAAIIRDLFSLGNQRFLSGLSGDVGPSHGKMLRMHAVGGSRLNQIAFAPQYGVQTYQIGGKTIFDLDHIFCSLEDVSTLDTRTGFGSGIPLKIRKVQADSSMLFDAQIRTMMFATHDYINRTGEEMTPELLSITPTQRHLPFFELLSSITPETGGQTVTFATPKNMSIASGKALVEIGLLAHAVRLGKSKGVRYSELITSMVQSQSLNFMQGADGYLNNTANWAGLGTNFAGEARFITSEMNRDFSLNVQHQSIGVASSVVLRHLLARNSIFSHKEKLLYGTLPGIDTPAYLTADIMGKTGEFNKPFAKLAPIELGIIKDFIDQLPEKTKAYIASELGSSNNAVTIISSLGVINSLKLIKRQQENPAAFEGTIRHQIHIDYANARNGLSLQDSVDYAASHSLHTKIATVKEGERGNLGLAEGHEIVDIMKSVVESPEFWHGYFASLSTHKQIEIPNLPSPYSFLDRRHRSNLMAKTSYSDLGKHDFNIFDNGPNTVARQETYKGLVESNSSILRFGADLESHRYYDTIHGFSQKSSIGLANTGLRIEDSINFPNRRAFSNEDPTTHIGSIEHGVIFHDATQTPEPVSLEDYFYNVDSNINSSSESSNHVDYGDMVQIEDGSKKRLMVDDNEGRIVLNETGSEKTPVQIPILKTNIGKSLRDEIIRHQLALSARAYGATEISSIAARHPLSISVPTLLPGLTESAKIDYLRQSHVNSAFQGYTTYTADMMGRNDIPRGGLSWTRLDDGRLMINYTPTIDLNQLFKTINKEQQMGLPFKSGLGYDTATGTLIPQSSARMLWFSKELSTVLKNGNYADVARVLNGSIHFDQQVTGQHAKAFRVMARDMSEGDPLSAQVAKYRLEEGNPLSADGLDKGRNNLANLLNPNNPVMFGLTRESIELIDEPFHQQFLMDAMSQHNNHTFSYFTHILPKECTKEDIHEVILALHTAHMELNPANMAYNEAGFTSSIHSTGFNSFTHQSSANHASMYRTSLAQWEKRQVVERSKKAPLPHPELDSSENTSRQGTLSHSNLRKLASTNPDFAAHVEEMASRAVAEPTGYSVPAAERKLKLNGDKTEAIKLLFPGRDDLLKYAWDAGKSSKIDIFEKSDKSGFILSHNSITGMNADGTPETGRVTKTFRTRKEADAYATSLQSQGGVAGIPNALFGQKGYRMEKLNVPEAKGESAVNVDITPVVSLISHGEGNARTTISKNLFKVGNLDGIYTKKQATEIAKMLKSQDVITAPAPEVRRNIMLSSEGLENAKELERVVRARSNFGVAGSPFSFSSNLMKAIATGALGRDTSVVAYTGTEWFKILKAKGVSKGEMRVTGVAAMLHNIKDHHLTRDEFAQFAAAMYPTFYQTIDRRDIQQTNTARVARRITDPQAAINRIVHEHARDVGLIEQNLRTKISSENNPLAKQAYTTILDNIRSVMISSLAEIYGYEATSKLFEDKSISVGEIISKLKWEPAVKNEGTPPITAGSFWLFRHNLAKSYSDVMLSNLANSVGIDLKEFELTVDDFNHSRTDNAMEPIVGQDGYVDRLGVGDAARVGEFGYGVVKRTVFRDYASGYGDPSVTILNAGFNDATEITRIDNLITKLKSQLKETTDGPTQEKLAKMIESASNVKAVRKSFSIKDIEGNLPNHQHFAWMRRGIWEIGHLRYTSGVATLHTQMGDGPLALADAFSKNMAEQEIVPTMIMEETQSDKYQKRVFGKRNAKEVLPSTAEESAAVARLPEITRLQRDIEFAQNKRSDLIRETRTLNKPGIWNDALISAAMMKARMQGAHITTKYALLKSYEKIISGQEWGNNSYKGPEKLLEGLIVKTGEKIKIPKEVQERFGLPAEIEDFNIDENHMYAGWLYKELAEGYLHDGVGTYFGANPQVQLVTQLFGDKLPFVELPLGTEDYYGSTRSFRMDSQGLMTLKLLKTASMFDENLAAVIPRILSDVEAKESLFGINYDFDALGKRSIQILETKLAMIDSGQARVSNPKARAFLGRVIADLKAMDQMDGRKLVYPERSMHIISEQTEGWWGGDNRYSEPTALAELKTMEGLTKQRIFVIGDVSECYDRSIDTRAADNTIRTPEKYQVFLARLMSNKKIAHAFGNSNSPLSTQGTVRMSYIDALKMQTEIYAALHDMSVDDYLAQSTHPLNEAIKDGLGLNGADKILGGWDKILGTEEVREGNTPFPALQAPTDFNDASFGSSRIAPPAAQLNSKTVLGRYLEITFPSVINMYKSKKFISEQNANVDKLAILQKELNIELATPDELHNTMPDVLPLGEEGAYRGVQSSFAIMKAIQERQTAVSYIDGRYHINRYNNTDDIKIMYNVGPGRGGFVGSRASMNEVVATYIISEAQKNMNHGDFFGRMMRGELRDNDIHNGKFTHNGIEADLQTHYEAAVEPILSSFLIFNNDSHLATKRAGFEIIRTILLRSKTERNIETEIHDNLSMAEVARVSKIHKGAVSLVVNVPYGRANGYAANYGLPSWSADISLAGQSVAARNRMKHDLYTRPVVEHSNGVFNILDPKTGKLLVGDLTDPAMIKERVAQLSKYEGAVPVVSSWLGTFKPAGMYFVNSHLFNNKDITTGKNLGMGSSLDALLSEPGADPISSTYNRMVQNLGQTVLTADLYRQTETSIQRNPQITPEGQATGTADIDMADSEQSHSRREGFYGPAVTGRLTNNPGSRERNSADTDLKPDMAATLYAMGVTKRSSSTEIAAAIVQSTGFIAPSFIVKPKFPTEAHKFEMRKKIIEGIPLMSVGDFKNPNIKTKRAMSDYKWLTNRLNTRPMQRNNDDETTNR